MLKLRSIGIRDYSVLEGHQRIGRIRLADGWMPPIWLWNLIIHLPGGLPMGQTGDLDTAKADFKVAWERLLAKTSKDELAAAYKDLNIRDDGKDGPWRPAIIGRSSAGHKRAKQHAADSHPGACGCG